jgi:adenosylcobinamide-phosphate synthase
VGLTATAAVGVAAALDAAFAEPPEQAHPVAWFGRLVAPLDREWRHPDAVGVAAVAVLPALAAAVAGGTTLLAVRTAPATDGGVARVVVGATVASGWLFATTSRRMLLSVAGEVVAASADDVAAAREAAPGLVGRDPADLSSGELRSAAVESAAENLADGLVAPLLAFAVGVQVAQLLAVGGWLPLAVVGWVPLAVGVAAAAWVKAVNTMDSMLGYRSTPVGRASARLDDAVMWLPARASAALLALAAADPWALVRASADSDAPASPNSGWPMATLAAALGVRLEKPGAYVLNAGADLPSVAAARRGLDAVGAAGWLALVATAAVVAPTGVVAWP